jgi:hypothetical protein
MNATKMSLAAIKIVAATLGVVVCILLITNWDQTAFENIGKDSSIVLRDWSHLTIPLNIGVIESYVICGLCVAVAMVFWLFRFITDFKNNMGTLAGIGLLAVVLLICYYGLASSEVLPEPLWNVKTPPSESTSQLSGAGIYALYFMLGLGVLAIVVTEVRSIFR